MKTKLNSTKHPIEKHPSRTYLLTVIIDGERKEVKN
jgi:hypothetical protein